jgi:hypothetical protein
MKSIFALTFEELQKGTSSAGDTGMGDDEKIYFQVWFSVFHAHALFERVRE